MYILKNVNKEYSDNKTSEIALKNVSVNLPDQGMIMIVGRSGSGKTTLLNLLSLFDSPTEGKIEISGEDVSSFTEERKAYFRKYYFGYIFQEYNLFENLSVYDNVALAKEIQGEKANKDDILNVLNELCLGKYINKKVNHLSGGQKQRVAIARALIKNPKVILCDEPTGALDSVTSDEIFSLLKKISKDTLVVVATHDLEACGKFGDRIIEIKDGVIESDKTEICENEIKNENEIKKRISFGAVRKILGMNMKRKPVRLALATILMIISGTYIAIPSAINSSEKTSSILNSMYKGGEKTASISKKQYIKEDGNENGYNYVNYMSDNERNYIQNELNEVVTPVYCITDNVDFSFRYDANAGIPLEYVRYSPSGYMEINQDILSKYDLNLICGRLPLSDNEVVLTNYQYSLFHAFGYFRGGVTDTINNPTDLLNRKFAYDYNDNENLTIVGIVDDSMNQRYITDSLKKEVISEEFYSMMETGIHNVIFVNDGFHDRNYNNDITDIIDYTSDQLSNIGNMNYIMDGNDYKTDRFVREGKQSFELYKFSNSESSNGVYVSYATYFSSPSFQSEFEYYVKEYAKKIYQGNLDIFKINDDEISSWSDYYSFLSSNDYNDTKYITVNKDTLIKECIETKYAESKKTENVKISFTNGGYDNEKEFKINGIFIKDLEENVVVASDNAFDDVLDKYTNVLGDTLYYLIPLKGNKDKIASLVNKKVTNNNLQCIENDKAFIKFEIGGEYSVSYERIENSVYTLKRIALYSIIGIIPFVSLFMFYYFSGVIFDSRKDIGVIRSLGATNNEIMRIYLLQNGIFAFGLMVFVSILTSVFIPLSNIIFYEGITPLVKVINYSYQPYLYSCGIMLICILIGTLIPTLKILKMKIVDVIRNN